MMSKRLYIFLAIAQLSIVNCQLSIAQRRVVLDLDRTISLSTDSSLSAQKYQSVYDVSRYEYLSWQASRKPQISLQSTPVMYERYMTQRYVSTEDVDVYRQQRTFYSQAGISATQTMENWGGYFYGSTQLGFLRTFGDQNQTQFMTVPVAVGKVDPVAADRKAKFILHGIRPVHISGNRADLILSFIPENTFEVSLHIPCMDQHVDRRFLADRPAHEIMMPVRIAYDQYFHKSASILSL